MAVEAPENLISTRWRGWARRRRPRCARRLDLALSDAVKLQDFFYVALSTHGASAAGRDATWAHFTEKLDAYKAKVGEAGSSIMDASIVGACGGFCTEAAANDIVAFFEAHPLPRNTRKIDRIVESTRASAAYVCASGTTDPAQRPISAKIGACSTGRHLGAVLSESSPSRWRCHQSRRSMRHEPRQPDAAV